MPEGVGASPAVRPERAEDIAKVQDRNKELSDQGEENKIRAEEERQATAEKKQIRRDAERKGDGVDVVA